MKKGPEVGRHIKLYFFFHGNNFMLTQVTLEIKIMEGLKPFWGAFHGLGTTMSAGLD